jgi:aryl-alcohol dehydrogenase-like predicted oxidoreductase
VKIGLGTVQFGLNYGISNQVGQTPIDEVARIMEVARVHNIRVIDTAALYGNSEEVLGRVLPQDHNFNLITKTVRINSERVTFSDADLLENTFTESLVKLRSKSIYGLLIHNADDLLAEGGQLLMDRMMALKRMGLVTKTGVSVYTTDQVDKILQRYEIDLVQLPLNVLDQRLLVGGQLAALKARGVEIHIRSAFLQGVLLMEPETLPEYFAPVKQHLRHYHNFLQGLGIGPVRAALGFIEAHDEIDVIVCGVNNHYQLIELCQASGPLPDVDFSSFALDDAILNPSQWRNA